MDPSRATEQARAREKPGRILVAFGGDNSFNWLLEKDILQFDEHYERLSQQPNVAKVGSRYQLQSAEGAFCEIANMRGSGLLYTPAGLLAAATAGAFGFTLLASIRIRALLSEPASQLCLYFSTYVCTLPYRRTLSKPEGNPRLLPTAVCAPQIARYSISNLPSLCA